MLVTTREITLGMPTQESKSNDSKIHGPDSGQTLLSTFELTNLSVMPMLQPALLPPPMLLQRAQREVTMPETTTVEIITLVMQLLLQPPPPMPLQQARQLQATEEILQEATQPVVVAVVDDSEEETEEVGLAVDAVLVRSFTRRLVTPQVVNEFRSLLISVLSPAKQLSCSFSIPHLQDGSFTFPLEVEAHDDSVASSWVGG